MTFDFCRSARYVGLMVQDVTIDDLEPRWRGHLRSSPGPLRRCWAAAVTRLNTAGAEERRSPVPSSSIWPGSAFRPVATSRSPQATNQTSTPPVTSTSNRRWTKPPGGCGDSCRESTVASWKRPSAPKPPATDPDNTTGSDLGTEIFIDAVLAAASNGEQGSSVITGHRVGPNTLAEIRLCRHHHRHAPVPSPPRRRSPDHPGPLAVPV